MTRIAASDAVIERVNRKLPDGSKWIDSAELIARKLRNFNDGTADIPRITKHMRLPAFQVCRARSVRVASTGNINLTGATELVRALTRFTASIRGSYGGYMIDQKTRQIRSHCPTCGPGRYSNVLASHEVTDRNEETDIWAATKSYMLECGGCKTVFFQQEYMCSEDYGPDGRLEKRVTYYPAPAKRKRPEWFSLLDLEPGLYSLLNETYNALDVDAPVLSATGARTVFDRASELLKIDPALTFKEKLDQLQKKGHISGSERAQLGILTDAGSAAAHRGWKPTADQLNTVMSIVETFIHRKFVLESEVKRLKAQIPPRKKRRKMRP